MGIRPGTWTYPAAFAARAQQKPRFLLGEATLVTGSPMGRLDGHPPGYMDVPRRVRGESPTKTTFFVGRGDPRDRQSDGSFRWASARVHGRTPPRSRREPNKNHVFCWARRPS